MGTSWIWTADASSRNAWRRFRRVFTASGGTATLRISADARYWVWLNGEYLGTGPVRSWPKHWKYDEYEVPLRPGRNVLAVLVNHYGQGESNFQYISAPPGLWAELKTGGKIVVRSDSKWKAAKSPTQLTRVTRIAPMQGFEEQIDARLEDGWKEADYNDSRWSKATVVPDPHPTPKPSGIPLLSREPVFPKRFVRAELVKPATMTWTLNLKPHYAPKDDTSNLGFVKGFIYSRVWSKQAQTVKLQRPHFHWSFFFCNGKLVAKRPHDAKPRHVQEVTLRAGWNSLLFPWPNMGLGPDRKAQPPGSLHYMQFVLLVTAAHPLRFSATGRKDGAAWGFAGPFEFNEAELAKIRDHTDYPRVVLPDAIHSTATAAMFDALIARRDLTDEHLAAPWFRKVRAEHIVQDAAAVAFSDVVVGTHPIRDAEAMLTDNADWTEIAPPPAGHDVRLLIDFGREVVGHHVFEIEAAAGTIVDVHNFEFIQPDGFEADSEGMNNSFRYITRAGRQSYRTLIRRGFQYSRLMLRNQRGPVRIRTFHAEFVAYPQTHQGSFTCNDALLNRIWEVGAHTLRCCAEDTYTDCPTYEQVHWVGDARNEALIDWVINGDPRLWFRCIEQTAQSLEHAPITLSEVPSAWANILPAWSFLWMRSCREYLLWTGDYFGAKKLWPWIIRNVDGIEAHLNADGLFEMQGWNMFDWAAMDTPSRGVITHLNCFAVLALNECAELGDWLKDKKSARRFRKLAASLAKAINRDLWDAKQRAYIDSIHHDGKRSKIFSQQTQTVALISKVATGARATRCRVLVHQPPSNFVKAGSPFFEFFLLEVLAEEGRAVEFLNTIRKDWGFMIEQGATTFWEMWSLKTGRLTRSHCHGWSAAPTFFLSSRVMGIQPTKPGFTEIAFTPQLGDLEFLRGTMPTPHGLIEVQCTRKGKKIEKSLCLPAGIRLSPTAR